MIVAASTTLLADSWSGGLSALGRLVKASGLAGELST
jgi:hypothetical protein